jgi:hypothetical protein
MRTRRTLTTTTALALVAAAAASAAASGAIALAPAASAKGLEVRSSGTCSAGATWKLRAKQDDRRIEVELEVDSNRVGQRWSAAISDNTVPVWSGTALTTAPSGSFEVRRPTTNRTGSDTIRAYARLAGTGQVCRAPLVYPG